MGVWRVLAKVITLSLSLACIHLQVHAQLQAQGTDSKDKIYHAYIMVDGVSRPDPNRCFKLTSVPVAVSSVVSGATRSYLYPVDCSTGNPIIDLASVESRLIRLESETLNNNDTLKLISEIISTYRLSVEMLINQSQELTKRVQALEAKLAGLGYATSPTTTKLPKR